MKRQELFWLNKFKSLPQIDYPTDFPRPVIKDLLKSNRIVIQIDENLSNSIYKVVKESKSTLFIYLLSIYNILLSKYTRGEDIIVGTLLTGRNNSNFENIIGMFINMLALRNFPIGNKTFKTFLNEVKDNTLESYENQDYQFDELVKKLGLQGETSKPILFNTNFQINNFEKGTIKIKDIEISPYNEIVNFAKFDLHFVISESNNKINILLRYSTELFKHETMEKYMKHFLEIINQVIQSEDIKISEIALSHDYIKPKSKILATEEDNFDF
jgi:non-ribosomal peptide synthetase component F